MREILFRGKRKDNGEWVEGFYMDYGYINQPFTELGGRFDDTIEVDPETVGQYTGLKDMNGKKIFEGDVLESRKSEDKADWKHWSCYFHDGSFCFETEVGKRKKKFEQNLLCKDEIDLYGLVVIGNIHDNPELLKGGAEEWKKD